MVVSGVNSLEIVFFFQCAKLMQLLQTTEKKAENQAQQVPFPLSKVH